MILAVHSLAMAGATCHISRRSVELIGKLTRSMHLTTLPGNCPPNLAIIAIHLYFPACRSRLGSQASNYAVGSFTIPGIDDTDTTVVTHLLIGITAIENDGDLVRCMAILIDELGDEQLTSSSKILRFYSLKRSALLNHIVAIDQDIAPHIGILLAFGHPNER